jgi:uncharacterized Zn-binding protein involved in type VI secretion
VSDRIIRIDVHSEITPVGVTVPVPHPVNTDVEATQTLVKVNESPVLRVGDKFRCQHLPKVGVFAQVLPSGTGEGKLAQAGQAVLKIDGKWVVSQAGTNTSCSEAIQEMPNRATTLLSKRSLLKVNGAAVLVGR